MVVGVEKAAPLLPMESRPRQLLPPVVRPTWSFSSRRYVKSWRDETMARSPE